MAAERGTGFNYPAQRVVNPEYLVPTPGASGVIKVREEATNAHSSLRHPRARVRGLASCPCPKAPRYIARSSDRNGFPLEGTTPLRYALYRADLSLRPVACWSSCGQVGCQAMGRARSTADQPAGAVERAGADSLAHHRRADGSGQVPLGTVDAHSRDPVHEDGAGDRSTAQGQPAQGHNHEESDQRAVKEDAGHPGDTCPADGTIEMLERVQVLGAAGSMAG